MTISDSSRLVLGTAQLGMNYGIANRTGKPNFKTAESIIKIAWEAGISEFDTAQGYGDSEQVLGEVFCSLGISNEVKVISKLHPELDHLSQDDLNRSLDKTLSNLKVSGLHGIMLHREELLELWNKGLGENLNGFIKSGMVGQLGVSVYTPQKAIKALKTEGISLVQLPSNLLDRRFEKAGVFELAENKKKQVYVRSIFLQGLLLLNSNEMPIKMKFAGTVLKTLEDLTQELGLSKQDVAVSYAKHAYLDAKIVFGVDNLKQCKDNLMSWKIELPADFVGRVQNTFQFVEDRVLNPVLWPN
jgi:aryl-alcohol dehydrogenase-like predicted oxidoreductase